MHQYLWPREFFWGNAFEQLPAIHQLFVVFFFRPFLKSFFRAPEHCSGMYSHGGSRSWSSWTKTNHRTTRSAKEPSKQPINRTKNWWFHIQKFKSPQLWAICGPFYWLSNNRYEARCAAWANKDFAHLLTKAEHSGLIRTEAQFCLICINPPKNELGEYTNLLSI